MANFREEDIQKVWEKGIIKEGYNSKVHRFDMCGALMRRDKYGDRDNNFGWEIDHVVPESKGGGDDINNLQPLQWENNLSKLDKKDNSGFCVVSFTPSK